VFSLGNGSGIYKLNLEMNHQFTEVTPAPVPVQLSGQIAQNEDPNKVNGQSRQPTEINPDNITATINEMIKDTNVLSAFELNEKNLQFLKELRKEFKMG
jgi:hypothetical protein